MARPVDGFRFPGSYENLDVLGEDILGLAGVLPEAVERVREKGPASDARFNPAVRQHVDGCVVLGQSDGVVVDAQRDPGREPKRGGALGNSGEYHRGRRQDVVAEVVLTEMDGPEPGGLGHH